MTRIFESIFLHKNLFIFWLSLIFFSSLYSIENLGGRSGVFSPYNISVYFTVLLFICFTAIRTIYISRQIYSRWWVYTGLLILGLLSIGFINADKSLVETQNYFIAGVAGFAFFWSLFQYQLTQRKWFDLLLIICLLGLVQSVISVIQRFDHVYSLFHFWTGYFPFSIHTRYLGSIQHYNMLPVFMALTVVISLYLISFKSFKFRPLLIQISILGFVALGSFVVLGSSSRAGILALLIGTFFIVVGRRKGLVKQFKFSLMWLFAFLVGLSGSFIFPGELSVSEKVGDIVDGVDARLYLFATSWHLFWQQPIIGHGLGDFYKAFMVYALEYGVPSQFDGEVTIHDLAYTHPHNEWFFWVVQTGLFAVVAFPVLFGVYFWSLYKKGLLQFLTLFGLLTPLLLSSQLSYPFTLSAIHFFGFLLLIYYGVRTDVKKQIINISVTVKGILLVMVFSVGAMGAQLTYVLNQSIFESYYFHNRYFLYQQYPEMESRGYYLYATKHHSYFEFVRFDMMNMLMKSYEDYNKYDVKKFIEWTQLIDLSKDKELLQETIDAYEFLGDCKQAELLRSVEAIEDVKKYSYYLNR